MIDSIIEKFVAAVAITVKTNKKLLIDKFKFFFSNKYTANVKKIEVVKHFAKSVATLKASNFKYFINISGWNKTEALEFSK